MFSNKLVNTKNKVIQEADKNYEELTKEINENQQRVQEQYEEELTQDQKRNISIFNKVVTTPKQYLDFIYNNSKFKKYLQYTLAIKEIDKKIFYIKAAILVAVFALSALLIILMEHNAISIILSIILIIVGIVIVTSEKTGISYQEYYNKTMSKLMISILPAYKFQEIEGEEQQNKKSQKGKKPGRSKVPYYLRRKILTSQELSKHFKSLFDSYNESNTLLYNSSEAVGGMCDLEIFRKRETKNAQTGKTTVTNESIFNGFYIKNQIQDKSNLLDKYIIEIREDENLFSALAEDTIHSFVHSEKEFTFNVEELNKALDCKIKKEDWAGDAVDKTIKVAKNAINNFIGKDKIQEDNIIEEDADPVLILHKVITPALEERFLYLRKRYNSFNMNLANSYISFNVNLEQTLFQKFKAKELFDSNGYKEHTKKVTFVKPSLFGNDDFTYGLLFPMLEKLFFIHYINLLYRFALKSNEVTRVELDVMNRFESEINEIMTEKYADFKALYKDEVKEIANMAKETLNEMKNS